MKEITLTRGFVAIVDEDDFDSLSQFKWRSTFQGRNLIYAVRSGPRSDRPRRSFLMHRVIMDAKLGQEIDHINGNGLDNRRSNLRFANRSQQLQNARKRCNAKTSQFKGVCWNKEKGKFAAEIYLGKKNKFIGYFDTEIEAAKAYNHVAEQVFGEFAKLNDITPPTQRKESY